jgi:capsid protein
MFRTIGDFEFNELQASTTAACPALVIKQTAGLGAPTLAPFPSDDPSVDSDGNRKMFFQPGMIPVMRTGEDIVGFNSNRPNDKCEDFTKHLLRQICGAFPLKASEIHGDYRESSFSSEASAECSLMPYVLALHEWFVSSVCEPIFEEVVLAGRLNGYLNGFEQGEGDIYERRLTEASYPLPEIRSINPTNDVKAAVMRVAAGFSSPQQEAAKFGNNDWESVIDQTAQYVAKLKEKDLPPEYGLAVLGVKTSIALKDLPGEGERDPDKQDDDGDDPEQADKDEKPKPKKPSSAA